MQKQEVVEFVAGCVVIVLGVAIWLFAIGYEAMLPCLCGAYLGASLVGAGVGWCWSLRSRARARGR